MGYCLISHWVRFPYHSKSSLENQRIGQSSANLCPLQSTQPCHWSWILCWFRSQILARRKTRKRLGRYSLHMPHVPQGAIQYENFMDGYGRFLNILFACLCSMGFRLTYLSNKNPLPIYKSISLTNFRPDFWIFIQLFNIRKLDHFHLLWNCQEKINQDFV